MFYIAPITRSHCQLSAAVVSHKDLFQIYAIYIHELIKISFNDKTASILVAFIIYEYISYYL